MFSKHILGYIMPKQTLKVTVLTFLVTLALSVLTCSVLLTINYSNTFINTQSSNIQIANERSGHGKWNVIVVFKFQA